MHSASALDPRAAVFSELIESAQRYDFVGVISPVTGGDPPVLDLAGDAFVSSPEKMRYLAAAGLVLIRIDAQFYDRNSDRGSPSLLLYPLVGLSNRVPIRPIGGSRWLVFLNDVIDHKGAVISERLISFTARLEGLLADRPFCESDRILGFGYEESLSVPPVALLEWPDDATFQLRVPDYFNPLSAQEFADIAIIMEALLTNRAEGVPAMDVLVGLTGSVSTALGSAVVDRLLGSTSSLWEGQE